MKHVKRLVSVVLAMAMTLAMASFALAEEPPATPTYPTGDGSITISNATVGQTYSVFKVFDSTYSGDAVAYSYTKTGDSDALYAALASADSPFTLTDTTVPNVYNVQLKGGKTAADVVTFLTANVSLLPKAAADKTADSNSVVFENLPYGYYYITSTLGSIVTVDSAIPDVTVIDKNQLPNWDNEPGSGDDTGGDKNPGKVIIENGVKKVVNSASYGDTVDFSIAVNASAYIGTDLVTNYYITDTLAAGFGPAKNIVVKVDGERLAETAYVLTQNGNTFEVNIPFGTKYGATPKIEVTYSAVVLTDAVIAGDGNLNTANYTYAKTDPGNVPDPDNPSDNPGEGTKKGYDEQNKKTTTTYVYALGFHKVDAVTKVNLSGAEFSIKTAEGATIGAVKNADGTYSYTNDATAEDYTTTFVSDSDGLIVVKGLKEGTYTVTETKAPAGYNVLANPVSIATALSETSSYTTTYTTHYDADGKVVDAAVENGTTVTSTYEVNVKELIVENNTGTELPSTGGMGTTIFYVVGGVLVVGAAVLLVVRKRMGGSKN